MVAPDICILATLQGSTPARFHNTPQGVKSLISTLVVSLPAFGNVGALIGLFFFMYAYVGVLLFGKVAKNVSPTPLFAEISCI